MVQNEVSIFIGAVLCLRRVQDKWGQALIEGVTNGRRHECGMEEASWSVALIQRPFSTFDGFTMYTYNVCG